MLRQLFDLLGPASAPWHVIAVVNVFLAIGTVASRPRTVPGRAAAALLLLTAAVVGICELMFHVDHPLAGIIWWSQFLQPAVVLLVGATTAIALASRRGERPVFTVLASFTTFSLASITVVPALLAYALPPNN